MIISKFLLNTVIKHLIKHFKLDKIKDYVFNDNELDETSKNHDDRIRILESMAHPKRDFVVCDECKQQIKQKEK